MDDLPNQTQPTPPTADIAVGSDRSQGSGAKESESRLGSISLESLPVTEIGKEIELPKEVSQAGVQIHPTAIPIPPSVGQMGVQPAGNNVTVSSGASVTLPLTDDQIVQGLHQNVTSSWRWLAEWCVRKLKKMHILLKQIGSRVVEIKES
jgi:hypothetical protein